MNFKFVLSLFSFAFLVKEALVFARENRAIAQRIKNSIENLTLYVPKTLFLAKQEVVQKISFLAVVVLSLKVLLKEVIQPHLPVRLPCYDFTPVTSPALGVPLHKGWGNDFGHSQLPWCDGRCVQGPGTYSPQYG